MTAPAPRVSAWQPPPVLPARPWDDDPAPRLEAHFSRIWHTSMAGLPFLNPVLSVAALPFARVDGDWLGVVLTPWFLHAYLLPGGGSLWQDLAQGLRRPVVLPAGAVEFIGDGDAGLGPLQYCVLLAPVPQFADQDEALAAAREALAALLAPPPVSAPAPESGASAGEVLARGGRRRDFLRGMFRRG